MPEWVYLIRPTRPGFVDGPTEREAAVMSEHFQYLRSLHEASALVLAGPALDTTFGIVVYEAAAEDEAHAIMERDPSVAAGVMAATLHPYRVSLLRGRH